MAKICAEYHENEGTIKLEKIENEIVIDNSVEEWIQEIERNVKKNRKMNRANRKEIDMNNYMQCTIIKDLPQVQQLIKLAEPTALMYR